MAGSHGVGTDGCRPRERSPTPRWSIAGSTRCAHWSRPQYSDGCARPEELEAELDAGPQNGSAHLRRAIEDVFRGVESISEAELADLIEGAGLPLPEYNVPILNSDGRCWSPTPTRCGATYRAALEVDSKKHHFEELKWKRSMRRHTKLTIFGLVITHYRPAELRDNPELTTTELEQWLRLRAAEVGIAYRPSDPRERRPRPRLHVPYVLPPPAA